MGRSKKHNCYISVSATKENTAAKIFTRRPWARGTPPPPKIGEEAEEVDGEEAEEVAGEEVDGEGGRRWLGEKVQEVDGEEAQEVDREEISTFIMYGSEV